MAEPGAVTRPDDPPRDPLEPLESVAAGSPRVTRSGRRSIPSCSAREGAQLDDRLRQQPPLRRARRAAAERARQGRRARGEIARAHHGSLAREERTKVEELLKAGELPCLVATSSLELGIDMGAVDLVLQIESPKSVARGLQRIGRAGHGVGEVSRGRIFPKFRGDLLECAVVARRMHEGLIEPTVVPRNALDVLAQQIVAIAVAASRRSRPIKRPSRPGGRGRVLDGACRSTSCTRSSPAPTPTPSSRASCWRTCSTCSTGATPRRSSASCARASSGIASPARSARARARASSRSPTPARSPTAASTRSRCPTGGASASSTRRWSMRRAPGRRSCSGPPPGGSRRSAATA